MGIKIKKNGGNSKINQIHKFNLNKKNRKKT